MDRLKEWEDWLDSEEGKAMIQQAVEEMDAEEELAAKLEEVSTLVYRDGQKVMRGDVFIDEYHEQLEENPYGVTSHVHRINDDGTIDNCFSSCYAWKANNYQFVSERSRLIRRNGKLLNPMYDSIVVK